MAEAREGCGGAGSLEAELTCPICLGLYREPALLSCGHNFCRQCIENVLRSQGPRMCPTCRAPLEPTVKLQNNFQLGNIVEAFQATTSEAPQARRKDPQKAKGSKKGKTGVVPCEYCLDGPQPAVKTCLACDVSMCKAHLRKHNAKSFQQEHVLVEVGVGRAEDRRCPEHGKPLEFFCLREDECICVLCSIAGAHKGHEVVTMKEGRDRQLVRSCSLPMAPALGERKGESRRRGGRAFTGNGDGCEGSPAAAPGISSPSQQRAKGALCWNWLFIPSCVSPEQCGQLSRGRRAHKGVWGWPGQAWLGPSRCGDVAEAARVPVQCRDCQPPSLPCSWLALRSILAGIRKSLPPQSPGDATATVLWVGRGFALPRSFPWALSMW